MADFDRARLEQLRAGFRRPTIATAAVRDLTRAARPPGVKRRRTAASAERLADFVSGRRRRPDRKPGV